MRKFIVVVLMGILSIVHGQQHTDTPTPPANDKNDLHVSAMYVLGDSSVDCGDNTLFYPLLHARLSLYSCNGSDATLLPQLIGTFLYRFFSVPLDSAFVIQENWAELDEISHTKHTSYKLKRSLNTHNLLFYRKN